MKAQWDPRRECFTELAAGTQPLDTAPHLPHSAQAVVARGDMTMHLCANSETLVITLLLPTIDPNDLAITVSHRTLTVTAKQVSHMTPYSPGEWPFGGDRAARSWSLTLPNDVVAGKAEVTLTSNELTIIFPRVAPSPQATDAQAPLDLPGSGTMTLQALYT